MYLMTLMMPSKSDLQDTIIVHQKNQMHPGSDMDVGVENKVDHRCVFRGRVHLT